MKPHYNGIELRKEYHALRLTLSPKEACEAIADRLLDDVERVRFSISYLQHRKICRDCWQEFRFKYPATHTHHRCPDCLRHYTNIHSQRYYKSLAERYGISDRSKSVRAQFYTNDELFHELVKVRHVYTAAEFGEALQDVKVFPHGLHQ